MVAPEVRCSGDGYPVARVGVIFDVPDPELPEGTNIRRSLPVLLRDKAKVPGIEFNSLERRADAKRYCFEGEGVGSANDETGLSVNQPRDPEVPPEKHLPFRVGLKT